MGRELHIAYLTPVQVKKLLKDSRVALITQDSFVEMSGGWVDNPPFSYKRETTSWGVLAVGGGNQINHAGTGVTVYVLDTGVGHHTDLGGYFDAQGIIRDSQVTRFNPNLYNTAGSLRGQLANAVGCYSHSTHVAGIIGAQGNLTGTRGVNPGVPIVSVATVQGPYFAPGDAIQTTSHCATNKPEAGAIAAGMDLIMKQIATSPSGKPGIVNISINSPGIFKSGQTIGNKLRALSQPGLVYIEGQLMSYPGAFIAQSAGNNNLDACEYAFDGINNQGALTFDGIMVVGAINSAGFPVSPANGGFNNYEGMTGHTYESGSNFGKCVDVWAPGNIIRSSWGAPPSSGNEANPQLDNAMYTITLNLSGTSMAAPHIAGMAAYLAETLNLITPQQIEAAVRARFIWQNTYDNTGYPVNMPVLP